ncbi:MAG: leucine-rich repeat protein [Coriobacteriia bacterium]|nr:leucine-rich repeat protein [Coriobacteriia bacterium]
MIRKKTRGTGKAFAALLALAMALTLVGLVPLQAFAELVDSASDDIDLTVPDDSLDDDSLGSDDTTTTPPLYPYFQITVSIPTSNTVFILPTSSILIRDNALKPYDWHIEWGDKSWQDSKGNSYPGTGLAHTYTSAGDYSITVTPNESTEAWLAAFGFGFDLLGANTAANRAMIKAVTSPLRPEMTRTTAQINGDQPAPDYEWAHAFDLCVNLIEAPATAGWEGITSVGAYFAAGMFYECSSLVSLPEDFNLPQGLRSVESGFASFMFSKCSNLVSLPQAFNLPQSIASADDLFASNMFYECHRLTALPKGFSLPKCQTEAGRSYAEGMFRNCFSLQDIGDSFSFPKDLSVVGDYFASDMFAKCNSLQSLPKSFNLPQSLTEVGANFASKMFSDCTSLQGLPKNFNIPQSINTVGENFLFGAFSNCLSLTELPKSFSLNLDISYADNNFAAYMFTDCLGLIALPARFNLPQGLTAVGDAFASYMFSNCRSLERFPDGFTIPQNITIVGNWFVEGIFSFCVSLNGLPEGFNLPQDIQTVGYGFAAQMLCEAGGPDFQINRQFCFPASIPSNAEGAFARALLLSSYAPVQTRLASSIINNCASPDDQRNTFDDRFKDLNYLAITWGGKGIIEPIVGAPGSGDLNNDGYVTMDEVIIALQATTADIGLTPGQFLALDMDFDGDITMSDVVIVLQKTLEN